MSRTTITPIDSGWVALTPSSSVSSVTGWARQVGNVVEISVEKLTPASSVAANTEITIATLPTNISLPKLYRRALSELNGYGTGTAVLRVNGDRSITLKTASSYASSNSVNVSGTYLAA